MSLFWKNIGLRLVILFVFGWGIAYLVLSDRNVQNDASLGGVAALGVPPVDPMPIGKIVRDQETGREFVSNQIIVEFIPDISEESALGIIDANGGKMLQRFTAVPIFLVQIPDEGDGRGARAAVKAFRRDARVKNAELNYLTTIDAKR